MINMKTLKGKLNQFDYNNSIYINHNYDNINYHNNVDDPDNPIEIKSFHLKQCKMSKFSSLGQTALALVLLFSSVVLYVEPSPSNKLNTEIYFEPDALGRRFDGRTTYDEYITLGLEAQAQVYGIYLDNYQYKSVDDKKLSMRVSSHNKDSLAPELADGGENNNERNLECYQQLATLVWEAELLYKNNTPQSFEQSKELALLDLLDAYGSPSAHIMFGRHWWLGNHEQCSQATFEGLPARYCVGRLVAANWGGRVQELKIGLCLPDKCDSISISRMQNLDQLEQLVRIIRLGSHNPLSSYRLNNNIYCLPDEDSPLVRNWSNSARLFAIVGSCWLLLVIICSLRYELMRFHALRNSNHLGLEPNLSNSTLVEILAIRMACRRLFLSPSSNPQVTDDKKKTSQEKGEKEFGQNLDQDKEMSLRKYINLANGIPSVQAHKPNLNVVDGVKVVSMFWLIAGHTMLFQMVNIANGRNFWLILRDFRFLSIMSGIYAADSFFTMTGILASYLKFKKGEHLSKFHSPLNWLISYYRRYMRFMPMYLLFFWYTRDFSQYIGSGPLWDYGTSEYSLRGMCKQESIWEVLFLTANDRTVEAQCVKPGWYLVCDFYFHLVSPLFLLALAKSRKLGYSLIVGAIALSLTNQFVTLFWWFDGEEKLDYEILVNYKPLFPYFVLKQTWPIYGYARNRIPAYLIGLLTGHLMFERSMQKGENEISTTTQESKKQLSLVHAISMYLGLRTWFPIITMLGIVLVPLIGLSMPMTGMAARIVTSLAMGTGRLLWAMAIARLVYVCTESRYQLLSSSFMSRLLSSPKWRPWSKIGMCALFIQWEIIKYLYENGSQQHTMTLGYLLSKITLASIITYPLATLVYLMLEAPISLLEERLILQKSKFQ